MFTVSTRGFFHSFCFPLSVPRVLLAHVSLFLELPAIPQSLPEAVCYDVMFANLFFSAIWKIGFSAECLNKALSSSCCPISDISSEILHWSVLGLILQSPLFSLRVWIMEEKTH